MALTIQILAMAFPLLLAQLPLLLLDSAELGDREEPDRIEAQLHPTGKGFEGVAAKFAAIL